MSSRPDLDRCTINLTAQAQLSSSIPEAYLNTHPALPAADFQGQANISQAQPAMNPRTQVNVRQAHASVTEAHPAIVTQAHIRFPQVGSSALRTTPLAQPANSEAPPSDSHSQTSVVQHGFTNVQSAQRMGQTYFRIDQMFDRAGISTPEGAPGYVTQINQLDFSWIPVDPGVDSGIASLPEFEAEIYAASHGIVFHPEFEEFLARQAATREADILASPGLCNQARIDWSRVDFSTYGHDNENEDTPVSWNPQNDLTRKIIPVIDLTEDDHDDWLSKGWTVSSCESSPSESLLDSYSSPAVDERGDEGSDKSGSERDNARRTFSRVNSYADGTPRLFPLVRRDGIDSDDEDLLPLSQPVRRRSSAKSLPGESLPYPDQAIHEEAGSDAGNSDSDDEDLSPMSPPVRRRSSAKTLPRKPPPYSDHSIGEEEANRQTYSGNSPTREQTPNSPEDEEDQEDEEYSIPPYDFDQSSSEDGEDEFEPEESSGSSDSDCNSTSDSSSDDDEDNRAGLPTAIVAAGSKKSERPAPASKRCRDQFDTDILHGEDESDSDIAPAQLPNVPRSTSGPPPKKKQRRPVSPAVRRAPAFPPSRRARASTSVCPSQIPSSASSAIVSRKRNLQDTVDDDTSEDEGPLMLINGVRSTPSQARRVSRNSKNPSSTNSLNTMGTMGSMDFMSSYSSGPMLPSNFGAFNTETGLSPFHPDYVAPPPAYHQSAHPSAGSFEASSYSPTSRRGSASSISSISEKPAKRARFSHSASKTRKESSDVTSSPSCIPKAHKSKSGSWNGQEHRVIERSLRQLRQVERAQGIVGRQGLRDLRLWNYISDDIKSSFVNRTASACKNYWSRFGRAQSGFDERAIPVPNQLATSLQTTHAQSTQPTQHPQALSTHTIQTTLHAQTASLTQAIQGTQAITPASLTLATQAPQTLPSIQVGSSGLVASSAQAAKQTKAYKSYKSYIPEGEM